MFPLENLSLRVLEDKLPLELKKMFSINSQKDSDQPWYQLTRPVSNSEDHDEGPIVVLE